MSDKELLTERQLLELAANAAGLSHSDGFEWIENESGFQWNPLEDDGDALRLAVKLELDVWIDGDAVEIFFGRGAGGNRLVFEVVGTGCPYAATRRAIVHAAAEIGANVK